MRRVFVLASNYYMVCARGHHLGKALATSCCFSSGVGGALGLSPQSALTVPYPRLWQVVWFGTAHARFRRFLFGRSWCCFSRGAPCMGENTWNRNNNRARTRTFGAGVASNGREQKLPVVNHGPLTTFLPSYPGGLDSPDPSLQIQKPVPGRKIFPLFVFLCPLKLTRLSWSLCV